jgi:hypothetical protein
MENGLLQKNTLQRMPTSKDILNQIKNEIRQVRYLKKATAISALKPLTTLTREDKKFSL